LGGSGTPTEGSEGAERFEIPPKDPMTTVPFDPSAVHLGQLACVRAGWIDFEIQGGFRVVLKALDGVPTPCETLEGAGNKVGVVGI